MSEHQEQLKWIVTQHMSAAKVLVVGDPIIDQYHFGEVTRISQEAPIPVFVEYSQSLREGGALNVLRQVRALGASGDAVLPDKPWTVKHRYLAGHHHVFRHDHDQAHETFVNTPYLQQLIAWCNIAIVSDYGKGCLSHEFCQSFIEAMGPAKHVIVDPRGGDWNKYSGATAICPNEHEWALHRAIPDATQPVFRYELLKLGAKGMQLGTGPVRNDNDIIWRSHTRARAVYDVTGAGDTVIATFSAAAHSGTSMKIAAELANMAAGIVVGKVGTSTCSREELLEEIDRG